MTTFPSDHRKSTRILNQKDAPACFAYAVGLCIENEYKRKGIDVKIDVDKFYRDTTEDGRIPHMIKALQHAKDVGVYDELHHKTIKIKSFKYLPRYSLIGMDIQKALNKGYFICLSLDLEYGETFRDRTVDGIVQRRMRGKHATVGVDIRNRDVIFANSYGTSYGIKGYGMIDLNLGGDRKTVEGGYLIEI